MTYAQWKTNKANEQAVFELFFRKNPFPNGQYTIVAGIQDCLQHLQQTFHFTQEDIDYLKSTPALSHCDPEFFDDYLRNGIQQALSTNVQIYAVPEGTVVFPTCPLLIVEAPLAIGHLLETTLLNLINYPSLIATNASRMVLRANAGTNNNATTNPTTPAKQCIEFGLRRAQGPDGACTASKYSYLGGFNGTSNVLAGKLFGIPLSGTHAHSYVQSFTSLDEAAQLKLYNKNTKREELFLPKVLMHRTNTNNGNTTNDGELAAFVAYACTYPMKCLCLIDTYDTLHSGLPNFIVVAKALDDFGYQPIGVRLDSGNLQFLSKACQSAFDQEATAAAVILNDKEGIVVEGEDDGDGLTPVTSHDYSQAFTNLTIVASNDINEKTLVTLSQQDHGITTFGIGTNLVTCQAQPALGCVYKLVELNGLPRIKLSQELGKVTVPGRKRVYRFYGGYNSQTPIVDYMCLAEEDPPTTIATATTKKGGETGEGGGGILCRHPFRQQQRLLVFPTRIKPLHRLVFAKGNAVVVNGNEGNSEDDVDDNENEGSQGGATTPHTTSHSLLSNTRTYVQQQLDEEFSQTGVTRYENPNEYNVMVSPKLYTYLHELWEQEAPIEERR
eukprot:CAMPEP_0171021962 /NCGR_PEP_ID=MMETSP0736-20130129/31044_1 /TAXON_ID=186038 /ORGANISM="Fragilariopsis kerguelensis, Strain L26-C5" /LENGTH=612 /DNA_ID=CAMNT_0011460497 /DNA_START=261 /DNA_END=2099 /DNA_ORIENTATION=+